MLVVPNSKFWDRVPIQVITKDLERTLLAVPIEGIFKLDEKWRQTHVTFNASKQMSLGTGQPHIPTTQVLEHG